MKVSFLSYNYKIYEMQHLSRQNELSCISIPQKHFEKRQSSSSIDLVNNSRVDAFPVGVDRHW